MDFSIAQLRARKLAAALGSGPTRRALTLGVAPAIEHIELLRTLRPRTIVDIGANRGQFALASRVAAPDARIICFEPGRRAFDTLTRTAGEDRGIRLVRAAVAREAGPLMLNVTSDDDSSSILPVGETQAELFGTRVVEQEAIAAGPLDSFLQPGEVEAPALLKIDVQGFERDVLLGSAAMRPLFRWVYVESSFVELYVGQMLAPELLGFMQGQGFALAGVFNQVGAPDIPAVQADFLFVSSRADPGAGAQGA